MSHSDEPAGRVVPAQLNFLAIYNPGLGAGADPAAREQDQIVFFYSRSARKQRQKRQPKAARDADESNDNAAVNEQLRQVGLAQGMVAFARDFSNGVPVDSVETERHRIVLDQLETGWWILASIDLTRKPKAKADSDPPGTSTQFDYSAREVSPPALLLQQLQCAHRIFLLHHSRSLGDLFARLSRDKFCDLLDRFWTKFSLTWDVLLHGNPAVDVYGGIKLAAGGELGIGVGEEDWGSAERDILEGLVRNSQGLVDLTVSRFGDAIDESIIPLNKQSNPRRDQSETVQDDSSQPWIGRAQDPGPADGVVFSGLGTLTRPSLRALTDWVTWIYLYGNDAYGVQDNPSSFRRKRRKQEPANIEQTPSDLGELEGQAKAKQHLKSLQKESDHTGRPAIPPPIVSAADDSLKEASSSATKPQSRDRNHTVASADAASNTASTNSEQWVKYLTLGYGSIWGPVAKNAPNDQAKSQTSPAASLPSQGVKAVNNSTTKAALSGEGKSTKPTTAAKPKSQSGGFFLLGLQGDLDAEDEPNFGTDDGADVAENDDAEPSSRITLRTLHVELTSTRRLPKEDAEEEHDETEAPLSRLRVVVYVHPPFIYTLLYDSTCVSISFPSCFHDLHHHLTPLHGPLLKSTSPATVSSRLQSILPASASPIYDLVHSASSLATHCSIPNIPAPGTLAAHGLPPSPTAPTWDRFEALNVHSQILSTYADTRRRAGERERTAKTGRGWWVVWMRVPTTSADAAAAAAASQDDTDAAEHSEAVLVRKASDHLQPRTSWMGGASAGAGSSRRTTFGGAGAFGRFVGGGGGVGGGSGADASVAGGAGSSGRLAEGIGLGLDPRRYVEVLLSLCR